ncbi:bacteriochlorophyll 4-vinyl reductase [Palleronia caenipelagi]|uniref:Bacteriochlorophyll 4-vinyl reductase n=1 Tax=Palleronia caenipelagi TaxID=2489174 RepID=A0A547Q094_9RHOB|nr:bacteriochlorophyll 4-vinyl reductase [Palleronia caenipelagi]TRD19806.1 bacteriochlorophyll 4-vinyl reductase [Palleronia caenipelagi]
MSEDERAAGLIGPNAILQLLPQLARLGDAEGMLARAGATIPDGTEMIPEGEAARLHRLLRTELPDLASELAAAAGRDTARYILAHRIPRPAQMLLQALPAPLAARALSRAITKHAWTFAGSGQFRAIDPWDFEIRHNPLIAGETSDVPLCHWHAAVFAHLYQTLVHPGCTCTETTCGAQPGHATCHFTLHRS